MDAAVDQTAISDGASDYLFKNTVNAEILERSIRYSMARKKIEQHLDHLAHYDHLTGLPNRVLFKDRLTQAVNLAQRTKDQFTLMYIDLNNFKDVNDSYGHNAGDLLLKEFASRLKSSVRRSDTVARIGGDEFTIILNNMGSTPQIIYIAQKILERMDEPFLIQGKEFEVGCSIGIAIYPDTSDCAESLQRNDDIAMYQAKKTGISCYRFFNAPARKNLPIQIVTAEEIDTLIQKGKLVLRYYPRMDLRTQQIVAVVVNPVCLLAEGDGESYEYFVRLMNNHDAIIFLTQWMIAQSLVDLENIYQQHKIIVSFPVRKILLISSKFCSFVKALVEKHNIHIADVEFTKIKMIEGEESLKFSECIENINSIGAQFNVSNFGENTLSLANIHYYNVSSLSISSNLLQSAMVNKKDLSLLEALIMLAHRLDKQVIANNIVEKSQLELLQVLNCDQVQGGILGKSLSYQDIQQLIENNAQAAIPSSNIKDHSGKS